MATKRQAPDDQDTRPAWKRRRPNEPIRPNHGKKSFKKAHPVNDLKSQIRNVRRLLQRKEDALPANVRIEKERELQTAERELQRAQQAKKRSDMIGKYHRIRFFERQKADRKLKKIRKELKGCADYDQKAELERKVEEAEVDLNYALYYPLDKDYVSLFPTRRKKTQDGAEDHEEKSPPADAEHASGEREGDREMWELVKKCGKEGTLADLREGRLARDAEDVDEEASRTIASHKRDKKQKDVKGGTLRNQPKSTVEEDVAESEDEDGVGFFDAS